MVPSSIGIDWPTPCCPTTRTCARPPRCSTPARAWRCWSAQGARGARRGRAGGRALGAGVAKALLGKDVIPDDLPYVTGTIGLLGTRPSWELMRDCDTLLMVGSTFPYTQFLPDPEQARAVQIDIDPTRIGLRYPTR